jgi:hypothetical protein
VLQCLPEDCGALRRRLDLFDAEAEQDRVLGGHCAEEQALRTSEVATGRWASGRRTGYRPGAQTRLEAFTLSDGSADQHLGVIDERAYTAGRGVGDIADRNLDLFACVGREVERRQLSELAVIAFHFPLVPVAVQASAPDVR